MSQAYLSANEDPFELLSNELCLMVLEHLDGKSLAAACAVSRRWFTFATIDSLWNKLHHREPWLSTAESAYTSTPIPPCPLQSWRYAFASRRRLENNWSAGKYTTFTINTGYNVSATRLRGRYLFTGDTSGAILMWDVGTRTLIDLLVSEEHSAVRTIELVAMDYENSVLLCGHHSGALSAWHIFISSGPKFQVWVRILQHRTKVHEQSIETIRFSERFIVTGSADNTIKVWSRPKDSIYAWSSALNQLYTLKGHTAFVSALHLFRDTLVSASPGDCTIKTWDLKTGCCTLSYQRPGSVAYAHLDGQKLVIGSHMRLYDERARKQVSVVSDPQSVTLSAQGIFQQVETGDTQLNKLVTVGTRGCTIWKGNAAGEWVVHHRLVDASKCRELGRGVKPPVPRHLQVDLQRVVCSIGGRILVWDFS